MSWWRRNRIWLLLLVPVLAIAIAASSYRMLNLYLPWQWSRPVVVEGTVGTLRQTYTELDDVRRTREVQVEVRSVTQHSEWDGVQAVAGGAMWRVLLRFEAEPDQFLHGCHIELVDADGNRYDFTSGLESAEEGGFYLSPWLLTCVPDEAPGPTVALFQNEIIESPIERPRAWRFDALIAMPEGVTPTAVRIGWKTPDYLVLEIP